MKAIIWDLDGVIVDSAPYHFSAWRELFGRLGKDYAAEDFKRNFGRRNDDILRSVLGNSPEEEIKVLAQQKEEIFRERIREKVKPLPGVLELLEDAHSGGFRMALVSSAPQENIELILSSLGIKEYFDCLISGQELQRGKPDPEGFLLAAEKLGVAPARCIVIEDALSGVEAAKRAGMKCIAVTTTHPKELFSGADLVVDSLEDVSTQALDSLLST